MRFLVAIFSSVFAGFSSVCYTKATNLNKAGILINILAGGFLVSAMWILSLTFGWIRAPWEVFTLQLSLLFIMHMALFFVLNPLEQKALKIEKLSALQPFGNVSRVVAILSGFLILWEKNIVTFIVAIFAFFCTMIYATGGKFHKFSRGITLFLISQFLRGIRLSITALFLTTNYINPIQLTGIELAVYQTLAISWFIALFLFAQHGIKKFTMNGKDYYKYRIWGDFIWSIGWIAGLILMAELGIITSSILSLITMATALIMGFLILHDKPKKKDIIFATFIVGLIAIGFVFRGVTI